MHVFTTTGSSTHDYWLVNGDRCFGYFPEGIIEGIDQPVPIHLKIGNLAFGATHIERKHKQWVSSQKMTVPELVHFKLGHTGLIYNTESHSKHKISMMLTPASLLVLEFTRGEFSVTTMYAHPKRIDGQRLGRYMGRTY